MNDSQANQLSQKIEKEVRQLIGDLNMQILILRQMLELQQHPQEQPKPPPIPPQPEQPPPEKKELGGDQPPREQRSNGHYQEKIVGSAQAPPSNTSG